MTVFVSDSQKPKTIKPSPHPPTPPPEQPIRLIASGTFANVDFETAAASTNSSGANFGLMFGVMGDTAIMDWSDNQGNDFEIFLMTGMDDYWVHMRFWRIVGTVKTGPNHNLQCVGAGYPGLMYAFFKLSPSPGTLLSGREWSADSGGAPLFAPIAPVNPMHVLFSRALLVSAYGGFEDAVSSPPTPPGGYTSMGYKPSVPSVNYMIAGAYKIVTTPTIEQPAWTPKQPDIQWTALIAREGRLN